MKTRLFSIFGQPVRIFVLSSDESVVASLRAMLPDDEVQWQAFSSGKALLEALFVRPPHMLICSSSGDELDCQEVIRIIKAENVFRQICAVLCVTPDVLEQGVDWSAVEVDDFIQLPLTDPQLLSLRLELALRRTTRTLDANPLTRLPGNSSIMQVIELYIKEGERFSLAYLDIDHFKSFNDKYGFARGDEILLMTARLLMSIVMSVEGEPKFVGHVGGDDFVFMLPWSGMEDACKSVINAFDAIVPSFYDAEDRVRGSIISTDRQGALHSFPLMSISIAVANNHQRSYLHYGEITQTLGQLKSLAKSKAGSNYVVDRRKY